MIIPLNDTTTTCLISLEPPSSPATRKRTDKDSLLITATFSAASVLFPREKATTAAHCANHEILFSSPPMEKKRTRKTVRFNERANKSYPSRPGVFHEDYRQFSYSAQDYINFKLSSKEAARRFVSADLAFHQTLSSDDDEHSETTMRSMADDGSYSSAVLRAYAACCQWCPAYDDRDAEESRTDEENDKDESSQHSDDTFFSLDKQHNPVLTLDEQEDLQHWVKVATTRLGLERHIVGDYGTDRSLRRRQIVWTALDLADEQQEVEECEPQPQHATLQEAYLLNKNPSVNPELIRSACEELSRPSRLFAHAMAVANFNAQ